MHSGASRQRTGRNSACGPGGICPPTTRCGKPDRQVKKVLEKGLGTGQRKRPKSKSGFKTTMENSLLYLHLAVRHPSFLYSNSTPHEYPKFKIHSLPKKHLPPLLSPETKVGHYPGRGHRSVAVAGPCLCHRDSGRPLAEHRHDGPD